jgi:hypothetical protein
MNYSTCKCEADSFHGDEYLPDADEYPPMQQWEIDEALADIIGDDKWLEKQQAKTNDNI